MSKHYSEDPAFCAAIKLVLTSEGGYADLEGDPGGPTMFGIAWNFCHEALKRFGITRDTVRKLTLEQARQIYYEEYWIASCADGLTDEGLAFIHLDCAVNCGVGTASRIMRSLSVNPKHFDGRGDNNEILFLRLVHEYEILRLDYYTDCRRELKKRFLEGWVNRMEFVGTQAMRLV